MRKIICIILLFGFINLTWTSQNQKGKMRNFKAWNY